MANRGFGRLKTFPQHRQPSLLLSVRFAEVLRVLVADVMLQLVPNVLHERHNLNLTHESLQIFVSRVSEVFIPKLYYSVARLVAARGVESLVLTIAREVRHYENIFKQTNNSPVVSIKLIEHHPHASDVQQTGVEFMLQLVEIELAVAAYQLSTK